MAINIQAFLQRQVGSTRVKLWFVSRERPGVGWFHEMDFDKALREEIASLEEPGAVRSWSALEASFFGPSLEPLEFLSRVYDERLLDQQLTRGTPPALSDPQGEPDPVYGQ